jgi:DNA-binding NarL/FixJ family response regulator
MSTPIVVIHPYNLFHDGLRQIFARSRFRPVRIAATLSEETETYLQSVQNCIWLIVVERCVSATNVLVRRVVAKSPGVKAVILAAYPIPDDIIPALNAGARGFLCQDILGQHLIKSLELIDAGETVVHPRFSWAQIAIPPIHAKAELEDNGALQAKNGEPYLTGHSDSRSSSPVPGVATEPSSEISARDAVQGLSRREMLTCESSWRGGQIKLLRRSW